MSRFERQSSHKFGFINAFKAAQQQNHFNACSNECKKECIIESLPEPVIVEKVIELITCEEEHITMPPQEVSVACEPVNEATFHVEEIFPEKHTTFEIIHQEVKAYKEPRMKQVVLMAIDKFIKKKDFTQF